MATYNVTHLHTAESFDRPYIFPNPHTKASPSDHTINSQVETFHRNLPNYAETKLHNLPSVAKALGFSHVLLKDESTRFGLPSFKIAGASWAIHNALCKHCSYPPTTSLADLRAELQKRGDVSLVTCTEGNWGRAVARMSNYLGIKAKIYVPGFMSKATQDLIRGEGADVIVLYGKSYDDAVAAAIYESKTTSALLVMDTSFDSYTEIPAWVTEGYQTILQETERQVAAITGGKVADIATCSVGVGSWAHAVVSHYRATSPSTRLISVEPDTAASFKESLHQSTITPVQTAHTIMDGMNCGTTSQIAWPVLREGVDFAIAVSDWEAHECVLELRELGVEAGPCGAANLAALKRAVGEGVFGAEEERKGSAVVLFSTEGRRGYVVPE